MFIFIDVGGSKHFIRCSFHFHCLFPFALTEEKERDDEENILICCLSHTWAAFSKEEVKETYKYQIKCQIKYI